MHAHVVAPVQGICRAPVKVGETIVGVFPCRGPRLGEVLLLDGLVESLDLPLALGVVRRLGHQLNVVGGRVELEVVHVGAPRPELRPVVNIQRLRHAVFCNGSASKRMPLDSVSSLKYRKATQYRE